MRKERESLIKWVKGHRKELLFAGVSVATIIAILSYKNRDNLLALWTALKEKLDSNAQYKIPVQPSLTTNVGKINSGNAVSTLTPCILSDIPQEVRSHIRNLPANWNASAEKLATAAENGYSLLPGQIWVNSYTKKTDCSVIIGR